MEALTKEQIIRTFASRMIDVEIAAGRRTRPIPEDDVNVVNYFTSTPRRRAFGLVLARDALGDDLGLSPSYIANEVGCSRNAVDTMIAEVFAYNLIRIARDSSGRRTIYCGESIVKCYLSYTSWVIDYSTELGIPEIFSIHRFVSGPAK